MIAEVNLFGLLVDAAPVVAILAAAATAFVRRLLAATGAWRRLWHPPLVDLALFALLWRALAFAADWFQDALLPFLG